MKNCRYKLCIEYLTVMADNISAKSRPAGINRSMIEKGYELKIPATDRRVFFRQMPRVNEQVFDLKADLN